MTLNKELNDCASQIEEHTMKLQLLNKQLKIAKDSLELAQVKQQEIKNKVLSKTLIANKHYQSKLQTENGMYGML